MAIYIYIYILLRVSSFWMIQDKLETWIFGRSFGRKWKTSPLLPLTSHESFSFYGGKFFSMGKFPGLKKPPGLLCFECDCTFNLALCWGGPGSRLGKLSVGGALSEKAQPAEGRVGSGWGETPPYVIRSYVTYFGPLVFSSPIFCRNLFMKRMLGEGYIMYFEVEWTGMDWINPLTKMQVKNQDNMTLLRTGNSYQPSTDATIASWGVDPCKVWMIPEMMEIFNVYRSKKM